LGWGKGRRVGQDRSLTLQNEDTVAQRAAATD
jgi:hypothetical protein